MPHLSFQSYGFKSSVTNSASKSNSKELRINSRSRKVEARRRMFSYSVSVQQPMKRLRKSSLTEAGLVFSKMIESKDKINPKVS